MSEDDSPQASHYSPPHPPEPPKETHLNLNKESPPNPESLPFHHASPEANHLKRKDEDDGKEEMQLSEEPLNPANRTVGETAFQLWNWHKTGGKKPVKRDGVSRQWYTCSMSKSGCMAKIFQDEGAKGLSLHIIEAQHNHDPPDKVKVRGSNNRAKVQKIQRDAVMAAANPQVEHQVQFNQDVHQAAHNVAFMEKQFEQNLPTNDSFLQIRKYAYLIPLFNFLPSYTIVISPPGIFDVLYAQPDCFKYVWIENTVDIPRLDLQLTTLLIKLNNIGLPIAWIIHDTKVDYILAIEQLQAYSNRQFCPTIVFGDLDRENNLKAACKKSLCPNYFIDYYHFVQMNSRMIGASYTQKFGLQLEKLYFSPNQSEFEQNMKIFLDYWEMENMGYAIWFKMTFRQVNPPSQWAPFTRDALFPSGTEILKSFAARQRHIFSQMVAPRLDTVVELLIGEFNNSLRSQGIIMQTGLEHESDDLALAHSDPSEDVAQE
eukprot:TRINITY_DN2673_c1_g1_i1.p1 TRINITY_DN2673_c1_g1~~TRINITY_DN2673_c1_g1_i1.p1  ORF type:complete len:487 (-),score=111.44 TRINITY_DN2673_c1_g1_i1:78-1538(-)